MKNFVSVTVLLLLFGCNVPKPPIIDRQATKISNLQFEPSPTDDASRKHMSDLNVSSDHYYDEDED